MTKRVDYHLATKKKRTKKNGKRDFQSGYAMKFNVFGNVTYIPSNQENIKMG